MVHTFRSVRKVDVVADVGIGRGEDHRAFPLDRQELLLQMQRDAAPLARSASLTRSILLRSRRDGTISAPISRSTLWLAPSCNSYVGSDASTTNSSSDASSASASVDRNDATRSCGNFLMNPTVSETSTPGFAAGCMA